MDLFAPLCPDGLLSVAESEREAACALASAKFLIPLDDGKFR
jgi:hypothetical protein